MDIEERIIQKKAKGLLPIAMIDANGDYLNERVRDRDKRLEAFIERTGLEDPYYERCPGQISTNVCETRWLN